ncbi:centrosomal AT-AC splicing factor isoform X2 [Dipodomys spectabilis]|uniref:centrosomal AT-AC splicing factor isoform X2 n=1 Tax=Dipodomys spectabilis TaxID=105255 RepID=UPI001C546EDD|nr:centrosomal AT-AC splicing factor isoform X2 [Dipodomys spectabilis]
MAANLLLVAEVRDPELMAPPQRCPLCRQTFFCGRGHVYSRKHQRQLKGALERLLSLVEAARKAIRAAQVERFVPEHERCCWCPCCGREVRRHLSHGNLTVLHGGLLEHLASPEHKKATNKFWWENKAEIHMKEKFLISPQDYARFKKSMVKGLDSFEEKEDEVIKEMAAQIREVEQSRQEVVRSVLEPQAEPEPEEGSSAPGSWKETNSQIACSSQQPSQLDLQPAPELDWMETGQPLTFIGRQDTPGVGNIHSGATPPWMIQDEEHSSGNQPIGPSYEEFLKEKEKEKLKKLPPDRVGANFDHSSNTTAGWLPSFGRVWNNGRRWQSRHQFKTEAAARNKQSHTEKS